MIAGFLGYSLVFELFVLYMAWHLWLSQWSRRWVYFLLFVLVILWFINFTPNAWSSLFSGNYGFIWDDIFR